MSAVTVLPFLVQEIVVAGPPVEVQVRVNTGESELDSVSNWKFIAPEILIWPPDRVKVRRDLANLVNYQVKKLLRGHP